jgi:hypothetical protein
MQYFNELTLDQKRYLLTGAVCLFLLLIYALSRVSEKPIPMIETAKTADFKNGSLTSDETSAYYKSKDEFIRKQYEQVLEAQKEITGKLTEMEKKMIDAKGPPPFPPESPSVDSSSEVAQNPTTEGDAEKKMNRRGQNQSKIIFPLVTQS